MTSDSDDLEEQLRENLKLRRELADEVSKAKAASQRGVVVLYSGADGHAGGNLARSNRDDHLGCGESR